MFSPGGEGFFMVELGMAIETHLETVPTGEWEELLVALGEEGGTALFLGPTDVGKSTLVHWLVGRLAKSGAGVALVDADVGQSSLCLPGTVGAKFFLHATDVREYACARLAFLGSPNPARIVFHLVEMAGHFAQEARREADLVLVDTTGLVAGEIGVGLKLAKIRATGADRVIAIQRRGECEPILERLRNAVIHRLAPSPLARVRSQETRTRRRAERLTRYFAEACTEFLIRADEAEFIRFGRDVSLRNTPLEAGTIIGLNRGKETMALGAVTEADGDGISFRSPLRALREINRVVLGEMREDREPYDEG